MSKYYAECLSAERLKRCYDLASNRIRQYLDAEIQFVVEQIQPTDELLELGCGYGRVLKPLCEAAKTVLGIDNSINSLQYAKSYLSGVNNCTLAAMDAAHLALRDNSFDIVVCIQNGISAFHVDQKRLVDEAVRICRPGGYVLFSTYAEKFWPHRLDWFEAQADAGLLGEIDHEKTRDGAIVCKDGFRATTVSENDFRKLTGHLLAITDLIQIDDSSLFCKIIPQ